MPKIAPFRAVRYPAGTNLQQVIAPPYDVLSEADVAELGARSEHNIVHIDVPSGGDEFVWTRGCWRATTSPP